MPPNRSFDVPAASQIAEDPWKDEVVDLGGSLLEIMARPRTEDQALRLPRTLV